MRRHLRWIIPTVFYTALGVFLLLFLLNIDYATLASARIDWTWITIATVVGLGARYWMVLIWLVILRGLGARKFESVPELAFVYAKSWMGRYIPGTAPWILGKIYFASQHGISKSKLAVSSLLEGGLQLLVQLVIGLILIAIDTRASEVPGALVWSMVAVAVVGIVILLPPVFRRVLQLGARLFRRGVIADENLPGYRTIGVGAAMYVGAAALSGISTFLVAKALWPDLSWETLPYTVGVVSLAAAASILAFFAPSGLGVREALLVLLLGLIMPPEIALLVAVVTRVWSLGVDLLFVGAAWLANRLSRRRAPQV